MALILIVEDEEQIRTFLKLALDDHHLVIEAANSQEALKLTALARPNLTILDLMLKDSTLSGADLCMQLSTTPMLAGMPILAISGFADKEAVGSIVSCATDFLAKPIDYKDLINKVDELLKLQEGKLTSLVASANEDALFQAIIQAAMLGSAFKITRALERAIIQIKQNLGSIDDQQIP
mgnify:CR=1 FL=1